MKRILCLIAAIAAQIAFAQPTEELPIPGVYNLPAQYSWSIGPHPLSGDFEIPVHPLGWTYVVTGTTHNLDRIVPGVGARRVFAIGPNNPFPKPGFKLPPGMYRSLAGGAAWGYFAPPTGTDHSGFDSYPAADRIWQVHRWLSDSLIFEVPPGKTYYITGASGYGEELEKWDSSRYAFLVKLTGDFSRQISTPGLRLTAGRYRLAYPDPQDAHYICGYVARSDW